ncbi:hypothetical protein HpMMM67_11010 [Helicobacter pylori]
MAVRFGVIFITDNYIPLIVLEPNISIPNISIPNISIPNISITPINN